MGIATFLLLFKWVLKKEIMSSILWVMCMHVDCIQTFNEVPVIHLENVPENTA